MVDETHNQELPEEQPQQEDVGLDGLTDQQRMFVEHYLQCWNGAKAARLAGYAHDSARVAASRLLTKANIRAAIDARLADAGMSRSEILGRLAGLASADMEDFFTIRVEEVVIEQYEEEKGALTLISKVKARRPVAYLDLQRASDAGLMYQLKKYSRNEKGESIELHDSAKALELLARVAGLLKDQSEQILKKIDLSKLTTGQLERLAAGEDVVGVLLNP